MILNRFFSWWLALSVCYCATFVQVHAIEHIPELLNPYSSLSFVDTSNYKSPIERAVDQCEICIHGSALEHAAILHVDFLMFDEYFKKTLNTSQQHTAFKHPNWSSIYPRAPPPFLMS